MNIPRKRRYPYRPIERPTDDAPRFKFGAAKVVTYLPWSAQMGDPNVYIPHGSFDPPETT